MSIMRPVAGLGIAMLIRAAVEAVAYRTLLPGIVKVLLLVILSLVLLGACAAILVYQCYLMLMHAGLAQQQALVVLSFGLLVLSGSSAIFAMSKIRTLKTQLQPLSPLKEKIFSVAHAFSEGFRTPSR